MRWNTKLGESKPNPKLDELTEKIIALCREYGVTLSHEDDHGSFEFEGPSENNEAWLRAANDDTDPEPAVVLSTYACKYCGTEAQSDRSIACRNCTWAPMMKLKEG